MKKRMTLLFAIMCLLLSSCGGSTQTLEQNPQPIESMSDETEWTLENIELPDPEKALEDVLVSDTGGGRDVLYMGLVGETVYRCIRQYDETKTVTAYGIQRLDAPYAEWETNIITLEQEAQNVPRHIKHLMTFTAEGELQYLYEEKGMCYLEKITKEGYSRNTVAIEGGKELLEKADKWYLWEDSNYIHTSDGLYCYGEDFTASKRIAVPNAMLICQMAENASGKALYLCGGSEEGTDTYIWRYDEDTPVITEAFFYPGQEFFTFFSDTEGYLCERENIWQFDVNRGSMEKIESYKDWGYSLENIYGASAGENTLLILAQKKTGEDTKEEYLLLKRREREASDKIRLELALNTADTFLRESVALFNRQNEEYEVILRERPNNAAPGEARLQEWEDYCNGILTEITSGRGPALIDTNILSVETGAAKGYLRDLTEDFATQREQCTESIWRNGMVNERLYAVPYLFLLNTFVIPDKMVGDKTGWTLEELMQLTRESGVQAFGENMNSLDLFLELGIRMEEGSGLIDWQNKVCHLNSPEAVQLLEFSVEYGNEKIPREDFAADAIGDRPEVGDRILSGETLAENSYFSEIQSLQHWETHFQMCDSVPVFIGFPTESGEAGHIMTVYDFAVNQSCEYPEGAVAFLQFLQSQERQDRLAGQIDELGCGYPVRRASLEQIFDKAMRGEYELPVWEKEIMGEKIETKQVSQETFQKFMQVIETAKPRSRRAEALFSIVDEELAPFYAGDKSAQEVLDILQNRVQLYMDEMN